MNASSRWANTSSIVARSLADTFYRGGISRLPLGREQRGAVHFLDHSTSVPQHRLLQPERWPLPGQPVLPIRAGPLIAHGELPTVSPPSGRARMLHVPGADGNGTAGDRSHLVLAKPNVIMNDNRPRWRSGGK